MHHDDLPNLFVIGAPKCGTTSMFRWLAEHPSICVSNPKETFFFADRELDYLGIRPNHRHDTLSDYLSLFERANESTLIKMEGCTHYLYSEPARNFVSGISPRPRIIVQLRNPAKRIWSHFNYIKLQATAPILVSFPDYVETLLSAHERPACSKYTKDPWSQHLLESQLSYSDYVQHLRLWLDRVPRDHLEILILEQLAQQTRSSMQRVAEWIGVDPNYYSDFEFRPENVSRSKAANRIRNRLGRCARYFPKWFSRIVRQIVDKSLRRLNQTPSPEDQKALARIEDFYAGPNRSLQRELGVDISSWSL